jgi:hypothetical protein
VDTLEELEFRAQETLVEEDYLTDGDRAFFYLTQTKLLQSWAEARSQAEMALTVNQEMCL